MYDISAEVVEILSESSLSHSFYLSLTIIQLIETSDFQRRLQEYKYLQSVHIVLLQVYFVDIKQHKSITNIILNVICITHNQ